jgi:hypothetical protein
MTPPLTYRGYLIEHDPDEGYAWAHGGFFPSRQECRDDIDWWHAKERAAYPEFYEHEDTPALDPPWWITER